MDNTLKAGTGGDQSADGYIFTASSGDGKLKIGRMQDGEYTLIGECPYPKDENFHQIKVEHLITGTWLVWIDSNQQTLTTNTADRTFADFTYLSTTLSANPTGTVNALDNLYLRDTPDELIVFHSDDNIWSINPDGTGKKQITSNFGNCSSPVLSPDLKTIYFISDAHQVDRGAVYRITIDGSQKVKLTSPEGGSTLRDSSPSISPDGSKIAFHRFMDMAGNTADVFVVGTDGSDLQRLTSSGAAKFPVWSPDGNKFLYTRPSSTANSYDIYVMDSDGTNTARIPESTDRLCTSHAGCWHSRADFPILLTASLYGQEDPKIFRIDVDGSQWQMLYDNAPINRPTWSPDGDRILFMVHNPSGDQYDIWRMDADGGNPAPLVESPSGEGVALLGWL